MQCNKKALTVLLTRPEPKTQLEEINVMKTKSQARVNGSSITSIAQGRITFQESNHYGFVFLGMEPHVQRTIALLQLLGRNASQSVEAVDDRQLKGNFALGVDLLADHCSEQLERSWMLANEKMRLMKEQGGYDSSVLIDLGFAVESAAYIAERLAEYVGDQDIQDTDDKHIRFCGPMSLQSKIISGLKESFDAACAEFEQLREAVAIAS